MLLDRDWEIRLAAMQRLSELRERGGGVVRKKELDDGFTFQGGRIPFWNGASGIFLPAELRNPGAALSIFTAPKVDGKQAAYDDEVAADGRGWFGYKYQGVDPDNRFNKAVRRAFELQRPLIYLYGITPGLYDPIFPVYVTGDDPESLTFRVEADVSPSAAEPTSEGVDDQAPRRVYQTTVVKRRIHQRRFRELVLSAYRVRCAMCSLGHGQLLDAAHIIPDRDDRGLPEVPNGLALCKIHHSAYDAHILGVAPDLSIHVRKDILREVDGPMLEHGLKGLDGHLIKIPLTARLQPNPTYLEVRFSSFVAA